MAALPPLTFQPLREDANDDATNERAPVATGRTLQKKLQMHGVAHGRTAGVKRKPDALGVGSSALVWIFFVFVLCGIVLTLFLTLG